MMSLSAIQEMSREAAARAFEDGNKPMAITENEWRTDVQDASEGHVPSTLRTIPNLGDPDIVIEQYPGEFELVETLFVDKSGFGQPGELALTVGEFAQKGLELTEEHGKLYWMIGAEGQFQIYAFALKRLDA